MTDQIASTREAFISALIKLASEDKDFVFVSADSAKAMRAAPFIEKYPERYFELGIAEQNAVAFSAGLASCGLKPFMATYAGFITMRACEQVRTFICYPELNVKFIGANGGIFGGEREGVTHQFFEDLGIMRCIPNMMVVVPADAKQTEKAVLALGKHIGPAFLRVGSGREPVIFEDSFGFELGKARILKDYGNDVAIFACGPIIKRVFLAAELCEKEGINVKVVEVHTLKPIDKDTIVNVLEKTGTAVTVEDHNIIGGLGSAVSEVSTDFFPVPVVRIGLQDVFPESGDPEALLDHYKMGVIDIVNAVKLAKEKKEYK
jgi:transketolase